MNAKGCKSVLATTAFLLFTASIAFARLPGLHDSARKSADVDFAQAVKVPNGPTLSPRTYKVALLNDSSAPQVGFYRNDKLVGQAPVKLIDQGQKIRQTEVYTQIQEDHSQVITEMDFSGWTARSSSLARMQVVALESNAIGD